MTDVNQRQVDSDIKKSMDLFERAAVGSVALEARRPQRILVALDGSDQDHAVVLLASQLSQRLGCRIGYCSIVTDDGQLEPSDMKALEDVSAERVEVDTAIEQNYDQILAAVEAFTADMLVVPCPFGRDFQSLGEDSTGTVIDVLTARCQIPFIAIRRPDAVGRDPTSHVRIVLTGENEAAEAAASWAIGLVQPAGRLELLLLVEESFYENFREMLTTLQPGADVDYEDLENALARMYARLHAGLQHAAERGGFKYELLLRYEGEQRPITPEDPRTHPALMVLGLQRSDHDLQGEVHDFIRRSPHPVLVVSVQ